jgi:hypothetical protein
MAQLETNDGKGIIGCLDPQATNFNPVADTPCGPYGPPTPDLGGTYTSGCCTYSLESVTGCIDPQANNYDPTAVVACSNCCQYGNTGSGSSGNEITPIKDPLVNFNPGGGDVIIIDDIDKECSNIITTISVDGIVTNNGQTIPKNCCTEEVIGFPVYPSEEGCIRVLETENITLCDGLSDGTISGAEIENRVICIDCDNFAWWDNLYSTINGSSLQDVDQDLWNFLVDIITSDPTNPLTPEFGNGSFYVDALTGEPIVGQRCCELIPNSNFSTTVTDFGDSVSACLCDSVPQIEVNCECLTNIESFIDLVSSEEGSDLYLNVNVLTSLGLTTDQATFVVQNLFSDEDSDGDGIPDSTNARILISNVLSTTGGFYVCNETNGQTNLITTKAIVINSDKCGELGGAYDGILCYCRPQQECELSLTDITVTTELDAFNQQVTIATFNGGPISETCCLQIASENNLPWVFQEYNGITQCYTKDPDPCLPLEFKLNENLIKPECETDLNLSASFYFNIPENPCIPIIEEDDDIIIVEPEEDPCLLTFDEENNLIDYNTAKPTIPATLTPPTIPVDENGEINDGEPCCFNPTSPITARLIVKDDKNNIVQVGEEVSTVDLESWVDVTTTFSLEGVTGTIEGYNVSLQFTSGLNCCCVYDIFLDNFEFSCSENLTETELIRNSCPGFDIVPVIDNKKSWVYNPGNLGYSNIQNQAGILTDDVIINNGEFSLINGYGEINRTFAPSPDADLPWRYTDYFKQSSVLEKHSNLVLNSKELFLTFDMCNIGGPCPDGYTLSAGTETCYKTSIGCPSGFTLNGGICTSGGTCDCLNIEWSLSGGTSGATLNTQFVGFQDGKRVWVFDVSGDTQSIEYRNATNSWLIFEQGGNTSYQFSSTTECPTSTLVDWVDVGATPPRVFTALTITEGTCTGTTASTINVTQQKSDPLACKTKLTLLELEGYKKTFQSFWVQFVEQFIPATTIFVSGERWCNRPDEICVQYEECDFDFEFVEGDVTTIPNVNIFNVAPPTSQDSGDYQPNTGGGGDEGKNYDPVDNNETGDGPIETPTVTIIPTPKENGETTTSPSFVSNPPDRLKRKNDYLNRLQPTETITE